jgi:hypothetical protein
MGISTTSRLAKAGALAAAAKIEDIHLLYLASNALEYLNSFLPPLVADFERRKKEWPAIEARQKQREKERRGNVCKQFGRSPYRKRAEERISK